MSPRERGKALQRDRDWGATSMSTILDPHRLARVITFIGSNLGAAVSTEDLATLVGLSPFHFSRAFKSTTGDTPHQYVIKRRMERARELLATSAPVLQVAHQVGYRTQAHFTGVFRRLSGVTPARYRKDHSLSLPDSSISILR